MNTKKPFYINSNDYYALNSKNQNLIKIKSSYNSKWLYKDNNNNYCCTSNPVRGFLSNTSEIAYPKIKFYKGDDPIKDNVIDILKKNNYIINNIKDIDPGQLLLPNNNLLKNHSSSLLNNNIKILIYDLETTGLKDTDRIIQIAIYNPLDESYYLESINPEMNIDKYIENLTGISNESIKNKPKFKDDVQNIENFIYKDTDENTIILMIAHNNSFDEFKLKYEYSLCQRNYLKNVLYCDSLDMFRCWIHGSTYERDHNNKAIAGYFKLSTSPKDGNIYGRDLYKKFIGESLSNGHNALNDVIALWKVLKKMFETIWLSDDYNFICSLIVHFTLISELNDLEF
jgi:DNA polymerase III epsilon subunit-like protein